MPERHGGQAEVSVNSQSFSKYAKCWLLALPILVGLVLLPGCTEDTYSESMTYPVRRDPIFMDGILTQIKTLEYIEPDPPGMLPLLTFNDIYKSSNRYFFKDRDEIFKNDKLRDPNCLTDKNRAEIKEFLDNSFGTPAKPSLALDSTDDVKKWIAELRLDAKELAEGSKHFRLHCMHCHGLTGDGRGPSGQWLNPHPRDYRQGLFKFQSVDQAVDGTIRPPRRADLYRTIHEGIDGTAMPAFNLHSEEEKNALVSYVIHLSIRGQVEFDTIKEFKYNPGKDELYWNKKVSLAKYMSNRAKEILQGWHESQAKEIAPGAYRTPDDQEMKESVQRGNEIFLGKAAAAGASCVSCHKDYGRQSVFKWDEWGTLGHKPRDFVKGQLRGGRRPIDIYYRIHSGINGSGMQNFGKDLTPDQIWDLVNLIRALPHPAMRKEYGLQVD